MVQTASQQLLSTRNQPAGHELRERECIPLKKTFENNFDRETQRAQVKDRTAVSRMNPPQFYSGITISASSFKLDAAIYKPPAAVLNSHC